MSSKRHVRARVCLRKHAFATPAAASAATQRVSDFLAIPMMSYSCRFAHHWHIGHALGSGRRASGRAGLHAHLERAV